MKESANGLRTDSPFALQRVHSRITFGVQMGLDSPNGGACADVDHSDSALRLGEVNLLT